MKHVIVKFLLAAGFLSFLSFVQCTDSTRDTSIGDGSSAESETSTVVEVPGSAVNAVEMTNDGSGENGGGGLQSRRSQGDTADGTVDSGNDDQGESAETVAEGSAEVETDASPEATPAFEDEPTTGDGQDASVAFDENETTEFNVDDVMSGLPTVQDTDREDIEVDDGEDSDDGSEDEAASGLTTTMHKQPAKKPVGKLRTVKVIVASKTIAQVWRNFKLVGRARSWKAADEVTFKARVGDSITILSKGWKNFFGVAAMIKPGGKRWYMTAGPGGRAFKAIGLKALKQMKKADLRSPRRKMCFLRYPYAVKPQRGPRYANNTKATLLFKRRAKYVWARGAKANEVIGVRFLVGGDRCKKPSATPKPGAARCACRVVRSGSKSDCLEFRNKRFSGIANKVGACRRRKCGLKYECVQPGRRSKVLCVRRFARFEVRSAGPAPNGKCRNVPLRPAQPYYAPYS